MTHNTPQRTTDTDEQSAADVLRQLLREEHLTGVDVIEKRDMHALTRACICNDGHTADVVVLVRYAAVGWIGEGTFVLEPLALECVTAYIRDMEHGDRYDGAAVDVPASWRR